MQHILQPLEIIRHTDAPRQAIDGRPLRHRHPIRMQYRRYDVKRPNSYEAPTCVARSPMNVDVYYRRFESAASKSSQIESPVIDFSLASRRHCSHSRAIELAWSKYINARTIALTWRYLRTARYKTPSVVRKAKSVDVGRVIASITESARGGHCWSTFTTVFDMWRPKTCSSMLT